MINIYLRTDSYTVFSHSTRSYCKRHSCFASGRRTSRDRCKRWRPDAEWSEKASWRLVRWNGVALAPALIQFSILVYPYLFSVFPFLFFSSIVLYRPQSNSLRLGRCSLAKVRSDILRNLEYMICENGYNMLTDIQIFSWIS